MNIVAFITIRLNSQRLKNKNILPLGNYPLSWYVCNTLLKCTAIDKIYIYCSEERIMNYVPKDPRLVFLKREKWLDGNLVRAQDTYTAFTNEIDADVYVAGLTTAPFIKAESINAGIEAVKSGKYDSAFSAKRVQTFSWYQGRPINYDPSSIPRTQDLDPIYYETSGFFVFTRELWKNYKRRIGFTPKIIEVDDIESIDIDTREDFELASRFLKTMDYERINYEKE